MQLSSIYLVNNRVDIIINTTGYVVEYSPVYNKNLKIYKGIENSIQFRVLNPDQKPVDISQYLPTIFVYDSSRLLILKKTGIVQDDGETKSTKGKFTISFTESELYGIDLQFLKYSITLTDQNSNRVLTYTDDHFGGSATIIISDDVMPTQLETTVVTDFVQSGFFDPEFTSEGVYTNPGINGNNALHTIAFYTSGYFGNIKIQGTLSTSVSDTTSWSDISTVSFSGEEAEPTVVNLSGMFNFIRFYTKDDPSSGLVKILVRN